MGVICLVETPKDLKDELPRQLGADKATFSPRADFRIGKGTP